MDFNTLIIFLAVFICIIFLGSFIFSQNNVSNKFTGRFLLTPISFSTAFVLSLVIIGAVFLKSIPKE